MLQPATKNDRPWITFSALSLLLAVISPWSDQTITTALVFSQLLAAKRVSTGQNKTRHLRQPTWTADMRRQQQFHRKACCEAMRALEAVGYPAAGDDAHSVATAMTAATQSGLSK